MYAVISSLTNVHFDLEIATILKLARSFTFNVRGELEAARFHVANDIVNNMQS